MGFDSSFSIFGLLNVIGPIFFVLVFGLIIFQIFRGIKQWSYNNQQPRLTVWAKVVAKRTQVSHHNHNHNNHVHHSTSTSYYVTFEVESNDRMEFKISGQEYGQLVENDVGKLTFQGTRYLNFYRQ